MDYTDWLVTDDGNCTPHVPNPYTAPLDPYRLYRFLTEIEDILAEIPDDRARLTAIAPRVRTLLTSSYWLQLEFDPPAPQVGWSVRMLYRDREFPLTVQMVSWLPGQISPVHNHATWGIVALIDGEEKNRFWRRSPTPDSPDRIELAGEKTLVPGDILCLTEDAIHSVEALGDTPTISFNLYGVTDFSRRFEFDPQAQTAKLF